ncbi:hypothetical protein ABAC460_03845 [Asticcacaulis sp. AC460]|uniref:hemerythrin domain-containing protein n=1 Tax=Asticcacaulis sp. AC460 TaxID=1282360 RepID=UPI0003C3C2CE|nr:hemerythrin domain-containing protein [Asticcacaulis sp. AC460]ESQ92043.1 hypothetical protein ABAC460_03845 [Asticcacaulis sp. AC460]
MDIFAYIKRDHRKVAGMMDDVMSIRLPAIRQNIFHKIRSELIAHSKAEEQTFYVAVEAAASESVRLQMAHSVDEHQDIADCLTVLDNTPISSEFWIEKFGELKQAVTHHVHEEENDVFPKARVLLTPAQARQLAADMDRLKQQFLEDMEFEIPAL